MRILKFLNSTTKGGIQKTNTTKFDNGNHYIDFWRDKSEIKPTELSARDVYDLERNYFEKPWEYTTPLQPINGDKSEHTREGVTHSGWYNFSDKGEEAHYSRPTARLTLNNDTVYVSGLNMANPDLMSGKNFMISGVPKRIKGDSTRTAIYNMSHDSDSIAALNGIRMWRDYSGLTTPFRVRRMPDSDE